jgi:hypothetical protein
MGHWLRNTKIGAMCALLLLTACHNGTGQAKGFLMEKEIRWSFYASAPRDYDVEVLKHYNYFIQNDGSTDYSFFSGEIGSGWGKSDSLATNLPAKSPIPKAVNLRWLSLTENQFYEGRFELPQAKIEQMIQDGYKNPRYRKSSIREPFSALTFGFAPGGGVVLWLWLHDHTQKEVAYFKAKPINMDWKEYLGNYTYMPREEYMKLHFESTPKYIQEQIRTKQLPIGLWEMYRTAYPWRLEVAGGLQEYWGEFVNGEQYMTFSKELAATQEQPKPVPQALEVYYTGSDGNRYKGTLKLNGFATYRAFYNFLKHTPNREVQLVITPDNSAQGVTVVLKEKDLRSLPLEIDSWKTEVLPEGY